MPAGVEVFCFFETLLGVPDFSLSEIFFVLFLLADKLAVRDFR